MEYSRGVPQTWVMQGWWLLAFILASMRLQTAVVMIENVRVPGLCLFSMRIRHPYLYLHVARLDVEQDGWQWDMVVFFVQFAMGTVVCILGLWVNEVPVLRIYERIKQKEPTGKAATTYSTFVPNNDERVRAFQAFLSKL